MVDRENRYGSRTSYVFSAWSGSISSTNPCVRLSSGKFFAPLSCTHTHKRCGRFTRNVACAWLARERFARGNGKSGCHSIYARFGMHCRSGPRERPTGVFRMILYSARRTYTILFLFYFYSPPPPLLPPSLQPQSLTFYSVLFLSRWAA